MRTRIVTALAAVLVVTSTAAARDAAPAHPAAHAARPDADAALKELVAGNARYVTGKLVSGRNVSARRAETARGQHPKAIVLGCSDSRVPPELVFDQGVGDLFVVRVAGNVAEEHTLGSIEYAAEHLGVPLLVVLGHHECGAVKATCAGGHAEGNVEAIVREIRPAAANVDATEPESARVHHVVHANARLAADAMVEKSAILRELVEAGKLKVVVAIYDLATGVVELQR